MDTETKDNRLDPYSVPDYGRYCLITWCLVTGIFSLFGNLALLISSLVSVLKLDKVSVVLIQNLAVTGVGFTVFIILPTVGSTVEQEWIYGRGLCVVTTYALYILGFMSTYLIASLNISKLTVLLFPLRARLRTKKCGAVISATLWVIVIILIVTSNVVASRDITFSPLVFACTLDYRFIPPNLLEQATLYSNLLVPLGVILATAIWLMLLIRSVRKLTRHIVLVLLAVSIAYILSYLPFIIFAVLRKQPMTVNNLRLYTVAAVATFISPFSNPIIFYFNIKSFKTYVDNKVLWVMGKHIEIRDRDVSGRYASRNSTRISTVSMRSTRDSVVINPINVAALQKNSTVVVNDARII
ncbi:G-protein coupled receptor 83-like [Bolinopsis microptera]|uniref:G-protein coupled receptor 83-like n=1 Tax=Bolinopsis microptera TaxID=2820187 RepID=UPI00307A1E1F